MATNENTNENVKINRMVLIVEDNIPAQDVLKTLLELEYEDIVADVCTTGEEAVEMAGKKDYDVIIMDIGLPGIDGIEATKRIKQRKPNQKIIAHSGHADIPEGLFYADHPKPMLCADISVFDELLGKG